MLNKEKYKDELEDILAKTVAVSKSGKIYKCTDRGNCKDCIFRDVACVGGARNWLNSECKETILTDEEKTYLSSVIKPFRDKVRYILKISDDDWAKEYIIMFTNELGNVTLPRFDKNTMYKGMKLDRYYELEELGL